MRRNKRDMGYDVWKLQTPEEYHHKVCMACDTDYGQDYICGDCLDDMDYHMDLLDQIEDEEWL